MTRLGGIPGSLERVTSISRFRRHLPHHGLPRGVRAAAGASSLLLTVALLSACGSSAAGSDAQQASALLSAGLQAAGRGNDTEAASDYHKCLSHEPKNKFCNYNLGVIDQGAGRNQSAEVFYRAALLADPNFVPALYNLALIRQEVSPQEAESLYRNAIAVQPSYAIAHLNLGFLLRSEGRNTEGNAELLKATQLDPKLASRIPAGLNINPPAPAPSPSPTR